MANLRIFRIRRQSCWAAGSANYYHHADVIAPTWQQAIKAAKDGRVTNWRLIDAFDSSDKVYDTYTYLYSLEAASAHRPARARSVTQNRAFRAKQRAYAAAEARKDRSAMNRLGLECRALSRAPAVVIS